MIKFANGTSKMRSTEKEMELGDNYYETHRI